DANILKRSSDQWDIGDSLCAIARDAPRIRRLRQRTGRKAYRLRAVRRGHADLKPAHKRAITERPCQLSAKIKLAYGSCRVPEIDRDVIAGDKANDPLVVDDVEDRPFDNAPAPL